MSEAIAGSIGASTRASKARFIRLTPEQIGEHISRQPGVVGGVEIVALDYPESGAGSSNGTAFIRARVDEGEGARERDLVLRFSPGYKLLKQKDYTHEYLTLRAVRMAGLPVPDAFWLDPTGASLGAPGFFMSRVEGQLPSAAMYSAGVLADATPEGRKALMLEAARFHGRLCRAGLADREVHHLLERGYGNSPLVRELNWWREEVRLGAYPPAESELLLSLHAWLVENVPPDLPPAALVHGDSQIANIMFRDGKIAAVLDWELSHIGYGELDIEFLAYITEFYKQADRSVDGTPTRDEYISAFERESGRSFRYPAYFQAMSALRNSTVLNSMGDAMPGIDQMRQLYREALNRARAAAEREAATKAFPHRIPN